MVDFEYQIYEKKDSPKLPQKRNNLTLITLIAVKSFSLFSLKREKIEAESRNRDC